MSKRNPSQPIESTIPADLIGFEAELAALRPRETGLDRDRLMFEAGRASMPSPRARLAWPVATFTMTSVAACLAILLMLKPPPTVIERVKIVEVERDSAVEAVVEEPLVPAADPKPFDPPTEPRVAIGASRQRRAASVVPRAGAEFRLFEHLMGQRTMPISTTTPVQENESKKKSLSPRSLPNLLERSAMSPNELPSSNMPQGEAGLPPRSASEWVLGDSDPSSNKL